jgi:hypothetical protein
MMQMAIGSKPSILTPLRSKHSLHSLGCWKGKKEKKEGGRLVMDRGILPEKT